MQGRPQQPQAGRQLKSGPRNMHMNRTTAACNHATDMIYMTSITWAVVVGGCRGGSCRGGAVVGAAVVRAAVVRAFVVRGVANIWTD